MQLVSKGFIPPSASLLGFWTILMNGFIVVFLHMHWLIIASTFLVNQFGVLPAEKQVKNVATKGRPSQPFFYLVHLKLPLCLAPYIFQASVPWSNLSVAASVGGGRPFNSAYSLWKRSEENVPHLFYCLWMKLPGLRRAGVRCATLLFIYWQYFQTIFGWTMARGVLLVIITER